MIDVQQSAIVEVPAQIRPPDPEFVGKPGVSFGKSGAPYPASEFDSLIRSRLKSDVTVRGGKILRLTLA